MRRGLAVLCFMATLGLGGLPAQAGPTWDGVWRHVTMIYPVTGGLIFYVDGAPEPNPTGSCEKNRLIIRTTDANYDTKLAAILTVYSTGQRIKFNYLSEALGDCDLAVDRFLAQS